MDPDLHQGIALGKLDDLIDDLALEFFQGDPQLIVLNFGDRVVVILLERGPIQVGTGLNLCGEVLYFLRFFRRGLGRYQRNKRTRLGVIPDAPASAAGKAHDHKGQRD